MKAIQSPNNGENRSPTGNLLSPNEASSTGIGLHIIGQRGPSHGDTQTTQTIAKVTGDLHKVTARPYC